MIRGKASRAERQRLRRRQSMAELSIDLMWTHADDAEFPNQHTVTFSGAQQVKSDAAPDWGGSELATNPEQALAAAMASCHMMTFLALAKKAKWPVRQYSDHATAHLGKNPTGQMAVVRINLAPNVTFNAGFECTEDMLVTMHERAHRYCFIANSLSKQMLETLLENIETVSNDPEVRVVIIKANGPAFCAGHDLREINVHREDPDQGISFFESLMALCAQTMLAIVNAPKPVIAQVNGVATAAGCQLVASCDLAYASEIARFSTPGVHIGLFCSTPMVALSRNVATKHAMEMLLVGDMVSASDAQAIGLINRCVSESDLHKTVDEVAGKIANKSKDTLKVGKQAFYEQQTMKVDAAYGYASEVMVSNLLAGDAREGISAFLEKRTPQWQS